MVTIKQVAKEARVSPTTASYALNNRPEVNEETKRRVLEVARSLNYVPNKAAHSLRMGRTNTFTVITGEAIESANTFAAEFFGILAEARNRKYDVLVKLVGKQDLTEDSIRTIFGSQISDGYLLLGNYLDDCVRYAVDTDANAVLLSSHSKHPIIQVNSDGRTWISNITNEALSSGKRFPIYLTYADATKEEKLRKQGYLDAMGNAEKSGEVSICGNDIEGIKKAVTSGLRLGADCFICWNDNLAYTVADILRKLGLQIPSEVAVTGFDDISTQHDNSFLSTVHQPFLEKGRKAVELLIQKISNYSVPMQEYYVDCKLVKRKSL